MKTLTYSTTTKPDFSGFNFYVEAGYLFCISDFCDAYKLDKYDFECEEVKSAQDAAGRLSVGEFLHVDFCERS